MIYWEPHAKIVSWLHLQFADAKNNDGDYYEDGDGDHDDEYEDDAATQRMRIALADGPTVNGAARRCDRTRSRVRAEQSRPPITKVKLPKERSFFAVNLTGRRAKPKAAHARAHARNQPCAHRQPPLRLLATQSHSVGELKRTSNKKKKERNKRCNRMRKMKMAKRKAQRSANRRDASCDVGREKPKRRRKSRKFTKSYKMLHFIPCAAMGRQRAGVGRRPGRTGQDRRAANRKTPFFSAACRLMRLQQMRRLPAVHHFCFLFSSLTHTHTHTDGAHAQTRILICVYCVYVCVWHAYCDISCGFRQFTTKCQEWWKASAGTKSFSSSSASSSLSLRMYW